MNIDFVFGARDSPHAFMPAKGYALPEQYPNIEGPKTAQIVPHGPKAAIVQLILYQSLPLISQPLGSIGRRP
jgi:hypothetical protein